MKIIRMTAMAVCGALALAATAGDIKADMQRMMTTYTKYVIRQDPEGMSNYIRSHFSPDFTFKQSGRDEMNLEDWIKEEIEQTMSCDSIKDFRLTVTGVKGSGNTYWVDQKILFDAMVKMGPGEAHHMVFTGTGVATVVWDDGKWWVKRIKAGNTVMTMDGKPFNMGGGEG